MTSAQNIIAPPRGRGRPPKAKDAPEVSPQESFPEGGRLYRLRQLATYPRCAPGPIAKSPATIWNDVKAGRFPAPVRIGRGAVAWKGEDLKAWLNGLSAVSPTGI
jgi:hypothetical protein